MNSNRSYPSLVGPIIIIGFGTLLLMNNLGMLQWSVWDAVLKLWPLLLVAAGLDLLIGRRSLLGNLLVAVLMVAMLLGGIWWIGVGQAAPAELTGTTVSQALEGARSAEVELRVGAGMLQASGGASAGRLLEGTVAADRGDQPALESRVANDVQKYTLRTQVRGNNIGPWLPQRGCDVKLTGQVPLTLRLYLGAGETTADLRGTKVTDVSAEVGAGRTVITLPAGGAVRLRVNVAVGETVVRVPKGSPVKVNVRTAVGMSRLPNGGQGFGQAGYTSPSYASAQERIELDISSAVGMVTVLEY